ncbi:hypothetical protein [Streptomyces sp. NPDC005148]
MDLVIPPKVPYSGDPIELPDGRKVWISADPDGSIRFRVDGSPYVLTEAHLSGSPEKDQAVVVLSPGKQGSNAAHNYVDELKKKNRS